MLRAPLFPVPRRVILAAAGVLLAAATVLLMPPDYTTSARSLLPPGSGQWLGTNDLGQDVLAGLLVGLPNTVFIPVIVASVSFALSAGLAAIAALRGGWAEVVILRLVEILQVLPSMFLLLLLASWISPGFGGVVVLMALISWHDDIRLLRAILLREINRENVTHARQSGAGWGYCLFRHVLPAVFPAVLAVWIQNIRGAVMRLSGLGFLGLIDPRLVTWGGMMQQALPWIYDQAWLWLLLPPALALSLFIGALIIAGRHLEEQALAGVGAI